MPVGHAITLSSARVQQPRQGPENSIVETNRVPRNPSGVSLGLGPMQRPVDSLPFNLIIQDISGKTEGKAE